MEFVSYGQFFNAFGEKIKIFGQGVSFRRRRLTQIARRAPLPLTINNYQFTINNSLPPGRRRQRRLCFRSVHRVYILRKFVCVGFHSSPGEVAAS